MSDDINRVDTPTLETSNTAKLSIKRSVLVLLTPSEFTLRDVLLAASSLLSEIKELERKRTRYMSLVHSGHRHINIQLQLELMDSRVHRHE
jgi:hypothetical protein